MSIPRERILLIVIIIYIKQENILVTPCILKKEAVL